MNLVLGSAPRPTAPSVDSEEYEPVAPAPQSDFRAKMSAPTPVKQEAVVEDDDALSYFASLASDD